LSYSPLGSFAQGGSFVALIADIPHNLPFLHACSVLNDTLEQFRDEGPFGCKSFFLGALLKASELSLPWKDFSLISKAVDRRNALAHNGAILPRGECWQYIDAIEVELKYWKVLTTLNVSSDG